MTLLTLETMTDAGTGSYVRSTARSGRYLEDPDERGESFDPWGRVEELPAARAGSLSVRVATVLGATFLLAALSTANSTECIYRSDRNQAGNRQREWRSETSALLHEVRRLSGLSWEQIAHLMGVSRRQVHSWAAGGEISRKNQQRLGRLVAVLRYVDRGTAESNRQLLFTFSVRGQTLFDLLAAGEFSQVRQLSGEGPGRAARNWTGIDRTKAEAYGSRSLRTMLKQAADEPAADGEEGPVDASDEVEVVSKPRSRRLRIQRP